MKAANYEVDGFCVNDSAPIRRAIEHVDIGCVVVKRSIDKRLIDLSRQISTTGRGYNGHIPVTVINSLLGLLAALVGGYRAVVFSNEDSASSGNTTWEGLEVNHQWAKSLAAEMQVGKVAADIGEVKVFSLLRPLSEIDIVGAFSTMTSWHAVFTSCNHAFLLDETRRVERWCNNCPKCRFRIFDVGCLLT